MNRFFINFKNYTPAGIALFCLLLFQVWSNPLNATNTLTSETTPFTVEVVTTDILCAAVCDGSALAVVTGGTPPFKFLWNNGDTRQHLDWEPAGYYEVTVTDADGHSATAGKSINAPTAIDISLNLTYAGGCNVGSTATATASATGGTPGYTFEWSTGVWGQTVSGLSPGNYWLTVTDANGCKEGKNFIVDPVLRGIQVDVTVDPGPCGSTAGATATANVTGGTAPYQYLLQPGDIRTQTVTGLAPGTYTFYVKDDAGCKGEQTFTVDPGGGLLVTAAGRNPSCNGVADGSVQSMATGGTPPYTYFWANGSTPIGSTPGIDNLLGGTYSVVVNDAAGCSGTATVTITEPTSIVLAISSTPVSTCSATDGTATANVSGGTLPYSYSWCNGQTGSTATGLSAGNCGVTITDANGCQMTGAAAIGGSNLTAVISNVQNANCGASDGSATVTANGIAPYTYEWCNGQTTMTATGLPAGDCIVKVTDAAGCETTITATIGENSNIVVAVTDSQNANCGMSNGSATVSASGGTAPYTYEWCNGQTNSTATGLPAGDCVVIVMDALGCRGSTTAKIGENDLDVNAIAGGDDCDSPSNSATAFVTGGTSPYSYIWSDGQITRTAVNLAPRDHSVTVTDSNGCIGSDTVTVGNPVSLTVNFDWEYLECIDNNSMRVRFNDLTGNPMATCLWDFGNGLTSTETNPEVVLTNNSTSVTLTKTLPGCDGSATKDVPLPFVDASLSGGNDPCVGEDYTVSVTNNNTSILTYDWFPNNLIQSGDGTASVDIITADTGDFQICVALENNLGCLDTLCKDFTINTKMTIDPDSIKYKQCDSLTLDFSGIAGTWYFDPADPNATATGSNPSHTYPAVGTYEVVVVPSQPCTDTIRKIVEVLPASFDFEMMKNDCADTILLELNDISVVPAMNGVDSWSWTIVDASGQNMQTADIKSPSFQITESGDYTVTMEITFGDGCVQEVIKDVRINSIIIPPLGFNRDTVCFGDTIKLNIPGLGSSATVDWMTHPCLIQDASGAICFIACVGDTTYVFSATINDGPCSGMTDYTLMVPPMVVFSLQGDTAVCDSTPVELVAVGNYSFEWSEDSNFTPVFSTNDTVSVVPGRPSTYYTRATDGFGCEDIKEHTVGNYQVDFTLDVDPIICIGDSTPVTLTSGHPGDVLDIIWSPLDVIMSGQGTSVAMVNPIDNATIFVETTNQFGCSEMDSTDIQVNNANAGLTVTASLDTIYDHEETELFATEGYDTYEWDPESSLNPFDGANPTATPDVSTLYGLTVTDEEGCIGNAEILITVLTPPCARPHLFLPNAFTPNGDDLNDKLFVRGNIVDQVHLMIFNRWGEKVFETRDKSIGWNGEWRDKGVCPDVYGYYMTIRCFNGEDYVEKGNITVLK